jgi:hypothetical protein
MSYLTAGDSMTELSTHLFRDKSDDPLEDFLVDFGSYRRWGVHGLSAKRKSPLEGYNSLERAYTDIVDRKKKEQIKKVLIALNYDPKEIDQIAAQRYREWRWKIEQFSIPRETIKRSAAIPNYGGNRFWSKVNRILSEMEPIYYKILIFKYEHEWELGNFTQEWGKDARYISDKLYKAKKAARRLLKKNGYHV